MITKTIYAVFALAALVGPVVAREPKPSNHVVVLLDTSGSYRSRITDATKRVAQLLEGMSKQETHRWDKNTDRIVLISLDALPAVIWEGTLRDLQNIDRSAWEQRIQARSDYGRCTDVDSAFVQAAEHLKGDPRYVRKFIFAFTDMQQETPTSSLSTCATARIGPSEQFPWDNVEDVSVSVFWMPPRQILPWKRAAAEHGLNGSFHLYSDSESTVVQVSSPPPPKRLVTEEEQNAGKASLVRFVKNALIAVGLGILAMILVSVVLSRRASRQRPPSSSRPPVPGHTPRATTRPAVSAARRS